MAYIIIREEDCNHSEGEGVHREEDEEGRNRTDHLSGVESNGMEDQSDNKFPAFPFKPYPIQINFMNSLYHSLNKGGISMLESPTGISLSIYTYTHFTYLFIYS